jgi:hypothetical protein
MATSSYRYFRQMLCAALCLSLLPADATEARPFFTNATDTLGVEARPFFTNVTNTLGVGALSTFLQEGRLFAGNTWGDYDNDGWPDLSIGLLKWTPASRSARSFLLHNQGNGTFADQTTAIRADLSSTVEGGGALFGDYDNDGDLDLFIIRGEFWAEHPERNVLLRNDRGVFQDVTLQVGLTDQQPTDNAFWLDYDRDGFLDLYTGDLSCTLEGENPDLIGFAVRNILYRNRGDGTFVDVTRGVGLDTLKNYYRNRGDGTFVDVTRGVGLDTLKNYFYYSTDDSTCTEVSLGTMAASDFNDDGWPDLYVDVFVGPNRLFLNDGQGGFHEVTTGEIADPDLTSGVAVGDIDNDGHLDLLIDHPSFIYLNNGEGIFENTETKGLRDPYPPKFHAFGDYDLDGFLDAWGEGLLRNNGNGNHYLRVEAVGVQSNRNGIGARLTATVGNLRQMREILSGAGHHQHELVSHFGLGGRTRVDQLEIRWPSGQVDILTDIPADQKIRVFEGRNAYHGVRPTVWESAPPDSLVAGSVTRLRATVRPALFESGAYITQVAADLSALGGSREVPLQAMGDSTWRLESTLAVEGPNGFRPISVLIEQETSLGPYWIKLAGELAVLPAGDLRLLDEELAQGWRVERGDIGDVYIDLDQDTLVYRGSTAAAFQGQSGIRSPKVLGWTMRFRPETPVDPVGFAALRFAFHPGRVHPYDTSPRRFAVFMDDFSHSVSLTAGNRVNMQRTEWQVVEIPLEAFKLTGAIQSITFLGTFEGTFYLDDVRLVAVPPPLSITAVQEEHAATVPQTFALAQNFPNPFNSSTVIRFALPQSEDVELSVFNLAGQKVATLLDGRRRAGEYSLNWDGRDDEERELASGVYLYRLQAGEKIETRKLVLVR